MVIGSTHAPPSTAIENQLYKKPTSLFDGI